MSGRIVYRLEPVLNQKEEEKNEATRNLAFAQKKLEDIREEIRGLENLVIKRVEEKKQAELAHFEKLSTEGMAAKSIQGHQAEMKAIDISVEEIKEKISLKKIEEKNAEQDLNTAKDRLVEATKEYKTMAKHKENFIREQRAILSKKEQKEMDEISSLIYNFKGKGDE